MYSKLPKIFPFHDFYFIVDDKINSFYRVNGSAIKVEFSEEVLKKFGLTNDTDKLYAIQKQRTHEEPVLITIAEQTRLKKLLDKIVVNYVRSF